MEIFESPFLFFIGILMSVLSFWLSWRGLRERDMPAFLYGTGIGVPLLSMKSWELWLVGILVFLLGWWWRQKLEM